MRDRVREIELEEGRWFPGYRPTALILFSAIWFSVGISVMTRPDSIESAEMLPIEYLPVWLRVALWWVPACCGLIAAFWPPGHDRWGWAGLSVPATFRAFSFLAAAVLGWIDFTHAISWLVILGILGLLATWPEPVTGEIRDRS